MNAPPELLRNDPSHPGPTLVLAHGAGAGMRHPWMESMAQALAAHGLSVVRFEFPYMRRPGRRPPDRIPVLLEAFREVTRGIDHPFAVGGKSMGGRVATMVASRLGATACVAFGYPFHPPGKPDRLRTEHLVELGTPTLIVQGERDPFGRREEVEGYRLSDALAIEWIPDGDHSLKPRKASGRTVEQNLDRAAAAAARFVLANGADRNR